MSPVLFCCKNCQNPLENKHGLWGCPTCGNRPWLSDEMIAKILRQGLGDLLDARGTVERITAAAGAYRNTLAEIPGHIENMKVKVELLERSITLAQETFQGIDTSGWPALTDAVNLLRAEGASLKKALAASETGAGKLKGLHIDGETVKGLLDDDFCGLMAANPEEIEQALRQLLGRLLVEPVHGDDGDIVAVKGHAEAKVPEILSFFRDFTVETAGANGKVPENQHHGGHHGQ